MDQAPELFRRYPRIILVVLAGPCTDEPYGERIRKQIERAGLADRVLLTGALPPNDPRVVGLLQSASVLLFAFSIRNVRPRHPGSLGRRSAGLVLAYLRPRRADRTRSERLVL